MEKTIRKYWPVFLVPTLAAFVIGFIVPFIMGVWLSFCDFTTVVDAEFNGITNYVRALQDTVFQHAFWFTALFAVVSLLVINVIAFALALALTQKMRGTNLFRTIFFMPNLIGGIVLGYIWQLIFNGILAQYSQAINLNEWYGFTGLVILVAWQQIGYMMIVYIAGLQSIPTDVLEAAEVDGAGPGSALVRAHHPHDDALDHHLHVPLDHQRLQALRPEPLAHRGASRRRCPSFWRSTSITRSTAAWAGRVSARRRRSIPFCLVVVAIGLIQLRVTRSREVQG